MSTGALENAMNLVFGTHGLFSMTTTNAHIHPLAQLISLGKGLVEASIRNIATSTMIAAGGGLLAALEPALGPLAPAAAGLATSTAFIGLTAGFVLFYVLPFLPFVYFYFAVATWVKTIFEAMVGVPLWALAHLRLDGEGLPGEAASNGYFLIFEIFIRPILSIVGMIASLIIFTAQVRLLHFVWMLVTENVGGTVDDTAKINVVGNLNINRSIIDEFFFTVMYAIIVYMLAIASFKLIDRIPDNLLRWMGQGVSSFSDINQDATEGLTRYAAVGGMQAGQQITQGISSAAEGTGGALASLFKQRPGV
jgi:conjugal transfer/type IV secretion protein DotA/TraY